MGCRRRAPQAELVRVVRLPDASLEVGRTLPGRGAWLCQGSIECLERAARSGAFDRALRTRLVSGAPERLARKIGRAGDVRGWTDTPAPPGDA